MLEFNFDILQMPHLTLTSQIKKTILRHFTHLGSDDVRDAGDGGTNLTTSGTLAMKKLIT